MMKKVITFLVAMLGSILILFTMGPTSKTPHYVDKLVSFSTPLSELQDSIFLSELSMNAKPCAYGEIKWADTIGKTDVVLLYLHGFSASQHEGDPLRFTLAEHFKMNAFYPRISGHGLIEPDSVRMLTFTAEAAWRKAQRDFSLALSLGRKVFLMSCSTGSPLAMRLAATYPDKVIGLINYSPNMGLPDPMTNLINGPWGLEILKTLKGTSHRVVDFRKDGIIEPCKATGYSWESVIQMQEVVESLINEEMLHKVYAPVMNMVWYESEEHQDMVISIPKARKMHASLGSSQKYWVETAAREHVILKGITSKDYAKVEAKSIEFLEEIL